MVDISNELERIVKISPSTLSLSLKELPSKLKEIEDEIDYIHVDVMDGKFVTNKTDGVAIFKIAKDNSKKPLDVHLMVENPLEEISKYKGAEIITFHLETTQNHNEILNLIKEIKRLSAKVGISIKPNTSTNDLKNILNEIDMVLIMTVEPGYGGQKLIPETLEKIAELRKMGFDKLIEVDGGITIDNATLVRNAGVDIIVAGTAVFSAQNKKDAINIIKGIM